MEYKGYTAHVEFDQAAGVLFGEVEGLRDVVTFEATNVKDLPRVFRESVEDYLAMCAENNEEPERPYSGRFVVRLDPSLHRELAMAAARAGQSLNALTSEVLASWVDRVQSARAPLAAPGPNTEPLSTPLVFHQKGQATEVAESSESLELFSAPPNTPSSLTPDTPASSRTPQLSGLKVA